MELTTTHKFLIVSGIAVILGWYILKPKEEIVTAVKKDAAVKKLSAKEREDILKEILAAKENSLNAAGKKENVINLDDYKLISDEELLSIKKILDAEKKHKINIRDGSSFEKFMKDDGVDKKEKAEEPLNLEKGTIDLGKIKFNLSKNISDKDAFEKELTKYELNIDDMDSAVSAIAKIGMIAAIPMLEGKSGKKISVIDSSAALMKKPALSDTPLVKKTMKECSPMADKLLKMEKDDKATRYTKEGMKKRGIEKKKIRTNIDANCGTGFFDEHKKQWNQSYTHQTPKISIKKDMRGGKKMPKPATKKYASFSQDDSLIFTQ